MEVGLCRNEKFTKTFVKDLVQDPSSFFSDERLKCKVEESTCLGYSGFLVELEHLKIKTTLIDEMFVSVMGEYVFLK